MIRKIERKDRDIYFKFSEEFYNSDGVLSSVSMDHFETAFDEMMQSDTYMEGYIIECGDTAAGYMLLAKCFSVEAGGKELWIDELYISPEFRGRGLASQCVKMVDEVYSKAYSRFRLECEPSNKSAIGLYMRYGYKELKYVQYKKNLI